MVFNCPLPIKGQRYALLPRSKYRQYAEIIRNRIQQFCSVIFQDTLVSYPLVLLAEHSLIGRTQLCDPTV